NEPLRILLLILEFEAVDGNDFGADFEASFGIEKLLDSVASGHAHMKTALGADEQIVLEIGPIERRFATRTLDPEPLGDCRLPGARRAGDPRRQQLLQPAHRSPFKPIDVESAPRPRSDALRNLGSDLASGSPLAHRIERAANSSEPTSRAVCCRVGRTV